MTTKQRLSRPQRLSSLKACQCMAQRPAHVLATLLLSSEKIWSSLSAEADSDDSEAAPAWPQRLSGSTACLARRSACVLDTLSIVIV